jgi:2-keto-4-pentenoate hydratase
VPGPPSAPRRRPRRTAGGPIEPLTEALPGLTVQDAYAIAQRIVVAWLANALAPFGTRLEAGDLILSGACTRMAPARAGDHFIGDFGELGRVALEFS